MLAGLTLKQQLDAVWNDQPLLFPCHLVQWHKSFNKGGYQLYPDLWYKKGRIVQLKLPRHSRISPLYKGYGAISRFWMNNAHK